MRILLVVGGIAAPEAAPTQRILQNSGQEKNIYTSKLIIPMKGI
ncbi:MAG TPA: hypothetical protein VET86_13495 [Casimicrobiaceae bacterium]|nr:hypothetical protein [Casimicrobiaceae bacterium]